MAAAAGPLRPLPVGTFIDPIVGFLPVVAVRLGHKQNQEGHKNA